MYEALFKKKDELIDAYETAELANDTELMKKLLAEIKEIQDEIDTEFF